MERFVKRSLPQDQKIRRPKDEWKHFFAFVAFLLCFERFFVSIVYGAA
jgi:hypothetical protein